MVFAPSDRDPARRLRRRRRFPPQRRLDQVQQFRMAGRGTQVTGRTRTAAGRPGRAHAREQHDQGRRRRGADRPAAGQRGDDAEAAPVDGDPVGRDCPRRGAVHAADRASGRLPRRAGGLAAGVAVPAHPRAAPPAGLCRPAAGCAPAHRRVAALRLLARAGHRRRGQGLPTGSAHRGAGTCRDRGTPRLGPRRRHRARGEAGRQRGPDVGGRRDPHPARHRRQPGGDPGDHARDAARAGPPTPARARAVRRGAASRRTCSSGCRSPSPAG